VENDGVARQTVEVRNGRQKDGRGGDGGDDISSLEGVESGEQRVLIVSHSDDIWNTLGEDVTGISSLQSLERLGEVGVGLERGLDGENDVASEVGDSRHSFSGGGHRRHDGSTVDSGALGGM
jgi:hypothetical protein